MTSPTPTSPSRDAGPSLSAPEAERVGLGWVGVRWGERAICVYALAPRRLASDRQARCGIGGECGEFLPRLIAGGCARWHGDIYGTEQRPDQEGEQVTGRRRLRPIALERAQARNGELILDIVPAPSRRLADVADQCINDALEFSAAPCASPGSPSRRSRPAARQSTGSAANSSGSRIGRSRNSSRARSG